MFSRNSNDIFLHIRAATLGQIVYNIVINIQQYLGVLWKTIWVVLLLAPSVEHELESYTLSVVY